MYKAVSHLTLVCGISLYCRNKVAALHINPHVAMSHLRLASDWEPQSATLRLISSHLIHYRSTSCPIVCSWSLCDLWYFDFQQDSLLLQLSAPYSLPIKEPVALALSRSICDLAAIVINPSSQYLSRTHAANPSINVLLDTCHGD